MCVGGVVIAFVRKTTEHKRVKGIGWKSVIFKYNDKKSLFLSGIWLKTRKKWERYASCCLCEEYSRHRRQQVQSTHNHGYISETTVDTSAANGWGDEWQWMSSDR